ncbi:MAG: hypothetical protein IPL21_00135 [Saprospirales bacterium]|nr:hypothetical protein [Saprospirales bacterium]
MYRNNTNVSVIVSPTPVLTVTNNAPTICSPAATNITMVSPTSGAVITWTTAAVAGVTGNADGIGTSIAQTLTSTNTTPTTVSYVTSITANGCTIPTQTVNVVVNPTLQVTITNNDDSLCSGDTSNIALSSTVAGTVFNWVVTAGGTTGALNGNGASIAQVLTNITNAPITVTYAVTPSFTNAGVTCTGTTQNVSVVVSPIPVLNVTNNNPSICSSTNTDIAISSPTAGVSFAWTTGVVANVTGNINGSGTLINQTLVNSGTATSAVYYTILASANGCVSPQNVQQVLVKPVPVGNANPAFSEICSVDATNVVLNSSLDSTTYAWTVVANGVLGASAGSGAAISQTLTNPTQQTIQVIYTVTPTRNGCSGAPFTVVVNVKPKPVADFLYPTASCKQTEVIVTFNGQTRPNATYSWVVTPATILNSTLDSTHYLSFIIQQVITTSH